MVCILCRAYGHYFFIASPIGMSFGELNHDGKGFSLSGIIFGFESQDSFEKAFVFWVAPFFESFPPFFEAPTFYILSPTLHFTPLHKK